MNTLNDAASYCVPLFLQLVENCAKAGVPVRIVDISRTPSQQQVKIATGVSWTQNSKHLPQPPEGKSEAIDIVPLVILGEHKPDWDPGSLAWQKIGKIGQDLGLEWGGAWLEHKDPSHFQYIHKPEIEKA
jgi:hypothetical protein